MGLFIGCQTDSGILKLILFLIQGFCDLFLVSKLTPGKKPEILKNRRTLC